MGCNGGDGRQEQFVGCFGGSLYAFGSEIERSDSIENEVSKRSGRQLQFLGGFASSLYALGSEIECSDSMKNEVSKRSGATVAVCGLFWGFLICVWVRNRAF